MPTGLINNTQGVRTIGDTVIAPGNAGIVTDDSWKNNAVLKAWIASGDLEICSTAAVDNINEGMDRKKAAKAAEAYEAEQAAKAAEEAKAAEGGSTPPPSK